MCTERRVVFIHSNPRQLLAARVAAHALTLNSKDPSRFSVRIIQTPDFPVLAAHEGRPFLRGGGREAWRNDDLQSFTPLRFAVPALMGYQGRALVIDPDVFATGDVNELLERDMGGAAILARRHKEDAQAAMPRYGTSVMLLDCARLRHWDLDRDFSALFSGQRDYLRWMELRDEPSGSVRELEPCWNDFDHLDGETRLLHNTRRVTQPWKTGLPVDFTVHRVKKPRSPLKRLWNRVKGKSAGGAPTVYRPHPDPAQERLFFALLAACVDTGAIRRDELEAAVARGELRADTLTLLDAAARDPASVRFRAGA